MRTQQNMSMRQLAAELGFASHTFIDALEKGRRKPSAELAVQISLLFGVTTDQLLRDDLELDE